MNELTCPSSREEWWLVVVPWIPGQELSQPARQAASASGLWSLGSPRPPRPRLPGLFHQQAVDSPLVVMGEGLNDRTCLDVDCADVDGVGRSYPADGHRHHRGHAQELADLHRAFFGGTPSQLEVLLSEDLLRQDYQDLAQIMCAAANLCRYNADIVDQMRIIQNIT